MGRGGVALVWEKTRIVRKRECAADTVHTDAKQNQKRGEKCEIFVPST